MNLKLETIKLKKQYEEYNKIGHGYFLGYSIAKGKYVIKKWRKKK